MRDNSRMIRFVLACSISVAACAQMTPDERRSEFQSIAALYARSYAPANWKIDALGVNIFDLKPWLDRISRVQSDLEFLEICSEYCHRLQDGHVSFRLPSSFSADLGLVTDIYDGKVLIESIDRQRYPAAQFPFTIGDELVSIDGRTTGELVADLGRFIGFGNPRAASRLTADYLPFRPQSIFPRAIELPNVAQVVIRSAETGEMATYELTWRKQGLGFSTISPLPGFLTEMLTPRMETSVDRNDPLALWNSWQNTRAELDIEALRRSTTDEEGNEIERNALLGWGSRTPYYGLPPGFQVRRGLASSDFTFSGVYVAEGQRIGLIRIPSFSPSNIATAIREIDTEIAFFTANTDGLVVDVTRNPGGICQFTTDVAARFMRQPFFVTPHQLMGTRFEINQTYSGLQNALRFGAPWTAQLYQFTLQALLDANQSGRALTGPLPLCQQVTEPEFLAPSLEGFPARDANGELSGYAKPMIVLADEFSVSAGDIFPAIIQDNNRGRIVGMRTGGLGGYVTNTPAGASAETTTRVTRSLMVRLNPVKAPGLPEAPYIENIGVLPDVELDYMTRDNLLTRGQAWVTGFTQIILGEITRSSMSASVEERGNERVNERVVH
jgi:hypothetical protein